MARESTVTSLVRIRVYATNLKAGVEAITMGVLKRGIGVTFLLGIKAGMSTLEYCM
jgi:hypothetical protein